MILSVAQDIVRVLCGILRYATYQYPETKNGHAENTKPHENLPKWHTDSKKSFGFMCMPQGSI